MELAKIPDTVLSGVSDARFALNQALRLPAAQVTDCIHVACRAITFPRPVKSLTLLWLIRGCRIPQFLTLRFPHGPPRNCSMQWAHRTRGPRPQYEWLLIPFSISTRATAIARSWAKLVVERGRADIVCMPHGPERWKP